MHSDFARQIERTQRESTEAYGWIMKNMGMGSDIHSYFEVGYSIFLAKNLQYA